MNNIKLTIAAALAISGLSPLMAASNKSAREAEIEKNVWQLISQMTIEEKIGQLNQLSGYGYAPQMTGMIRSGMVGSLLNEVDPVIVNRLQKVAVDSTRLHIPLIFARDVIHGYKTIFPIPLGQAATWDAEIVEKGARISAKEASSAGVRWTFSPMLDVARDARWGRIAEGFGEDTYLTSLLGAAMIKGYQGDDLSDPSSMAACAKHFAAYGAAESGRDYNTTWVPEQLLRDVYLPPFKSAVDAGAETFMCSFNDINGVPSSGNKYLLKDILRDEWGFNGLMVSDWGSIQQMIPHGYSADLRQAAYQAANAGVDMDMEGYAYITHLKNLVETGEVSVATVDSLVANVLRTKYRLGLFDNPYVEESSMNIYYEPESLEAAKKCAQEAAVLLKNNGILPIDKKEVKKIAVIGPMADAKHDQNGTWCFDLEKERTITPLASLTEMYGKKNIIYSPGLDYSRSKSKEKFAEAVDAASKSDLVLYFCGEEAVLSGEAHSRADISLPGAQTELLRELKSTGKPVVMIVMAGRPLTLPEENTLADAILFNFHPGTMGGPAIASLLSGEVSPSGRLPVSFPYMSGQLPLYYNRKNTGRPAEGITLIDDIELEAGQTSTGCTSFYLDAGDGALFPFGYGLTYSAFSYSDPEISETEIATDGTITASCTITNTGNREATEVAQLYIRDLVGSYIRPVRELKGFNRLSLKPGESKTVTFTLPASELAFYGADGKSAVEPGDFHLWIAPDSQSGTPVKFTVVAKPDLLSNK